MPPKEIAGATFSLKTDRVLSEIIGVVSCCGHGKWNGPTVGRRGRVLDVRFRSFVGAEGVPIGSVCSAMPWLGRRGPDPVASSRELRVVLAHGDANGRFERLRETSPRALTHDPGHRPPDLACYWQGR
jgi:hypothetical protein